MFGIFSKNKLTNKPNEDTIRKVKVELDQAANHLSNTFQLGMRENPSLMEMEVIEARKFIRQIQLEISAANMHIQNAVDIWSDGKSVLNEFFEATRYTSLLFENLANWGQYIQNPSFDISNPTYQRGYQNFVRCNREYGAKTEYQSGKAVEMLSKYGIDIYFRISPQ